MTPHAKRLFTRGTENDRAYRCLDRRLFPIGADHRSCDCGGEVRILAIDPGLSGAIALVDTDAGASVWDMPTMGRGKGTKQRVNMADLCGIIARCHADEGVIEDVSAMPGQGVTSMFSFGESFGIAQTAIVAANLPIHRVQPRKWKGHHNLGPDKDQARTRAIELFPDLADQLARKKDNGRAEALLIALWFAHAREACSV